MISVNQSSSNFLNVAQKALVRNTANEVAQAKEAGQPIDKEKIQASNQVVKDDLRSTAVNVLESKNQVQSLDTYIKASQKAAEQYNNSDAEKNSTTNNTVSSFDAQAVNETRQTVQRRAVGIEVYEKVQEQKVSENEPQINPLEISV